jgi:hypothetical protein
VRAATPSHSQPRAPASGRAAVPAPRQIRSRVENQFGEGQDIEFPSVPGTPPPGPSFPVATSASEWLSLERQQLAEPRAPASGRASFPPPRPIDPADMKIRPAPITRGTRHWPAFLLHIPPRFLRHPVSPHANFPSPRATQWRHRSLMPVTPKRRHSRQEHCDRSARWAERFLHPVRWSESTTPKTAASP